MEVVASLFQGRTAAAQCGLFTHKSVPVIFEPPCTWIQCLCAPVPAVLYGPSVSLDLIRTCRWHVKVVGEGGGREGTWGRSDRPYCQLNAIYIYIYTYTQQHVKKGYGLLLRHQTSLPTPLFLQGVTSRIQRHTTFTFTASIHRTAQYIKKVDPLLLNKGLKLKQ